MLSRLLKRNGLSPYQAMTAAEGLRTLAENEIDAVLLDLMLPDEKGLDLLPKLRERDPYLPVVVITAYSSIQSAIEAMRKGAFHYVPKPFKNEEVLHIVRRAVEQRRLLVENLQLRNRLKGMEDLVGASRPMREVFELVHRAAPSRSNILVTGEPGTGKELVARAIHRLSPRRDGPFIPIHTSAIQPEALEPILFGRDATATGNGYNGAHGRLEAADGGTLFLDEVGILTASTQAKLLQVIQEREVQSVGGGLPVTVDVRLIAATKVDLWQEVEAARFREDLYYRLNVISIDLPPLRERREDVPLLAHHFLRTYARENERRIEAFTPRALNALTEYGWPGNVRELENAVERCVALCRTDVVDIDLLPEAVRRGGRWTLEASELPINGIDFREAVAEYKKNLIVKALRRTDGVQRRAARLLKLKPTTLNEMIRRLNLRDEN